MRSAHPVSWNKSGFINFAFARDLVSSFLLSWMHYAGPQGRQPTSAAPEKGVGLTLKWKIRVVKGD